MLKISELLRSLQAEHNAFTRTFNREPDVNDPVFFQPDMETPVPMEPAILSTYMAELSRRTGATSAEVYAYHKLERIPEHLHNDLMFEAAVAEYYEIILAAIQVTKGVVQRGPKGGLKLLKPRRRQI